MKQRWYQNGLQRALVGVLHGYQRFISPLLGSNCRFYPSCSAYAVEALETHGALVGSYLSAKRLCRCQPFCAGGVDPVPPAHKPRATPCIRLPRP